MVKDFFKPHSVLIVLGSGGVGKTTIAAALGVAAAKARLDTAVITVDPARRLRDALALRRLGGKPSKISPHRLRVAGLEPELPLSAMMLDVKGAWDSMVLEHIGDPAARRRILDNPFYQSLSGQFAGSDAYAALEALYDLHEEGRFDLQVVDTPPAAHAFEFVRAPARLARLLDSAGTRWFFAPSALTTSVALRLAGHATRFVARELERFAGGVALSSIADFFGAAAGAVQRIVGRMRKVEALLRSPAVRFALVTTAEPDRLRQALELIHEMEAEGLHLGAIVINRFADEAVCESLVRAAGGSLGVLSEVAALRAAALDNPASKDGVAAVAAYLENYRNRIEDDVRRVKEFARRIPSRTKLAIAPEIRPGTPSLVALRRLAEFLTIPQTGFVLRTRGGNSGAREKRSPSKDGSRALTNQMPE